jgi:monoamine oxidase
MEQLPRRLAERLTMTRIALHTGVTSISKNRDGRYAIRFRRGARQGHLDVDAVVLALPYNQLPTIDMAGERLRRAMAAHVAHYDSPGHYLRVSILFDAPFWRSAFQGAWVMLDAFGGCCVYDESARLDAGSHGVLGWLLAGADALRLCNADDRTLIAHVLESLPQTLQREASARFIEGKVHRWAGAVSGQPGGFRLRAPREAHQPEPVEHPGVVVVGDYLFDSTLNGVLRSARIATDLVAEATGRRAGVAEGTWWAPAQPAGWMTDQTLS